MEGAKDEYIAHEVYVVRPTFNPSEAMFASMVRLLGSERDANRVTIYGSKEVTLDSMHAGYSHYDRHIALADHAMAAATQPILFTRRGVIGGPVRDRSTRRKNIRIAMPTSDQEYFNNLVGVIDDVEVDGRRLFNEDPQRPDAQHYPYFEVRPDQLPDDRQRRLELLAKFGRELMDRSHFILPNKYSGRNEARWNKITELPSSRPSLPMTDELSA